MANRNKLIHALNSMNNVMKSMLKYCHFDTRFDPFTPNIQQNSRAKLDNYNLLN
jgi:hypothetical protein